MNPYLSDILAQPEALRKAVQAFSLEFSDADREGLQSGTFDRILITGMGASLNAAYPAYMILSQLPIPVIAINAAELVHYLAGLIGSRTLLWINSQSGRSAEVVRLLEQVESRPPARVLACVNDETSTLAKVADICLPINAGPETSVSTKTYLNTLAINLLAARQMAGVDTERLKKEILLVAEAIEAYLNDWKRRVREIDTLLGDFTSLFLIGRGSSMSAVWNGSLINKEAARNSVEGMNAAEFRHGPLELVKPGFCAMIFAGDPATASLNRKLALDIIEQGGRAIWLDTRNDPELPTITIPETGTLTRSLAEILPMELLTLVIAGRKGIEPGVFQVVEKITEVE
jgi:glucosamine--fructose-6-phosphate aminotransferase (isomerizing)